MYGMSFRLPNIHLHPPFLWFCFNSLGGSPTACSMTSEDSEDACSWGESVMGFSLGALRTALRTELRRAVLCESGCNRLVSLLTIEPSVITETRQLASSEMASSCFQSWAQSNCACKTITHCHGRGQTRLWRQEWNKDCFTCGNVQESPIGCKLLITYALWLTMTSPDSPGRRSHLSYGNIILQRDRSKAEHSSCVNWERKPVKKGS